MVIDKMSRAITDIEMMSVFFIRKVNTILVNKLLCFRFYD